MTRLTNLPTETQLRKEQQLMRDQQDKHVREKTPEKPLWTQKLITSWVKSLAHRDEVKTPGLILAKYIEYIRQKWKEHQNDQIMLHTCKSGVDIKKNNNVKRTQISERRRINRKNINEQNKYFGQTKVDNRQKGTKR